MWRRAASAARFHLWPGHWLPIIDDGWAKMRGFRSTAILILFLALVHSAVPVASVHAETKAHVGAVDKALVDSLDRVEIDPSRCRVVRPGSEWSTPVGTYRFSSGSLSFLKPIAGRPMGCYFRGTGSLRFQPPTAIEQGQLKRFCGDSSLTRDFTELMVRYFDSTSESRLLICADTASAVPPQAGAIRNWTKRTNDDLLTDMGTVAWQWILRPTAPNAYILVTGDFKNSEPLYFCVDDEKEEAISVRRRPNLLFGKGELDWVCSYDRVRTPEEAQRRAGLIYGGFHIARYNTDVAIKSSGDMSLDVRMRVVPRRDSLFDMQLSLAPKLEVDSVWIGGDSVGFLYDNESGDFASKALRPLHVAETTTVRLCYRAKELLYKFDWGDFFISYTTQWLPATDERARADYETAFRFPKFYDLVSSGELLSDTVDGDWRVERWRTFNPSAYISFNYGSFDLLSTPMLRGPRLDIYRSQNHPKGIFAGDVKKAVAADIEGAMGLFSTSFAPYPWPHLAATEIPGFHGQGFPQLLHLAWYSFETSKRGVTDAFRAHEVAHQWFGHLVGWKTYHDQWLSEGFAEYAAAMYVQARYPGNKTFFDLVENWRKDILQVGGHEDWHAGPGVAPIWLGWRCESAASPASYGKLVYAKGAYVLHMLRNMLQDYECGSDDRFQAMMRDYVSTYSYREATTGDFQAIVERHMGRSMQWFFDQWVYGVQIPRYEYSWSRERTPDGHWLVRGAVSQFDVDSTFRVVMPITLVFEGGRKTFLSEIVGSGTSFVTPPLDAKPKDVLFDDYLTILCREKVVHKP